MNLANLKKSLIRAALLVVVFVVTLIVASRILNEGHDNITLELDPATYPMVTMVRGDFTYNDLHGYSEEQTVSEASDNLTVLGSGRELNFMIDCFGNRISGADYELRTRDGERLIENGEISNLRENGDVVNGSLVLKDLIQEEEIYSLEITLYTEEDKTIFFYTDVVWGDALLADEKLSFVQDFHDKLFDKSSASDIKKYIETNSSLNDNSSFASVDIHSSLDQITYGDLGIKQTGEPAIALKEISEDMAEITTDYIAFSGDDEDRVYYRLSEYFRIMVGKERMLLIDYQRSMEQLPSPRNLCINDKIVLGITDREVSFEESEDGNTVAFISAGKLFAYQSKENKLTTVFAFSGEEEFDPRAMYDAHDIKILGVDESGTVSFAVYGYMNSGRHEGEVGIEVYHFDGKLNTIEELLYIPYNRSYGILRSEMDTLLYLNRENHLFLSFENKVYCVDLDNRKVSIRNDLGTDDTLVTSSDHRILISRSVYEDSSLPESITLTNLKSEVDKVISADEGDSIRSLGFIGEDVIYGVAHIGDTRRESSGRLFFPMYKIVICDEEGAEIRTYSAEGLYITDVELSENQLTLKRVSIDENGRVKEEKPDYITAEDMSGGVRVTDATTVVDIYKTYVQLQLPKDVDENTLKIVSPKEIVYEGGRDVSIEPEAAGRYIVYSAYGVAGMYNLPSNAIKEANSLAGWVMDADGDMIWKRTKRSTKNQIMSITEEVASEEESTLAVCLDAMLKNEGVIRNSEYLREQGQSAPQILTDNLTDSKVLVISDCDLELMLYYINIETPVLALLGEDEAVLIVGYNDTNSSIIALDPAKGSLERLSYENASELFERAGSNFVTYIKN